MLAYPQGSSLGRLARRPKTLAETGLSEPFVADLLAKHLHDGGILTLQELSERVALAGPILEKVLNFMRREARVEIRGRDESNGGMRYALTELGRVSALDALMRAGYIGAAPVPLQDYARVARAQTVHTRNVNLSAMRTAFSDVVIEDSMLDQLGASLNSGRAIFVYGPAGTGKTYLTQRLSRLFLDITLIPHAISVDESVVQIYDPLIHKKVDKKPDRHDSNDMLIERGTDSRYVTCERPLVITGGELAADMLEVTHDVATKLHRAPLQLKANNGVFIIDDLGRQKVEPAVILNRWIVPMEEKKDYLTLGTGKHFSVPFDVILVFSTNINPLDLADEAFLRRIGYKIRFDYLSAAHYHLIWRDTCSEFQIPYDPQICEFAIQDLHKKYGVPLLPCHPRDLLTMAMDTVIYHDQPRRIEKDHVVWAWKNYFVNLDEDQLNQFAT